MYIKIRVNETRVYSAFLFPLHSRRTIYFTEAIADAATKRQLSPFVPLPPALFPRFSISYLRHRRDGRAAAGRFYDFTAIDVK